MQLKRILRSSAAFVLAAATLCSTAFAATSSSSVISTALKEVGTTEKPDEYTKYGAWYGYSHGYWCDMFVSWCAMTAGIPTSQFPRHCACTEHVKQFVKQGRYQESAARGNSYIPKQGDVIFFYNSTKYPSGSVKNHTGLVLYVEDGYVYTIEGNALANRLDVPYSTVSALRDGDLEPLDYVTVNCYPLDEPRIHGYGVPAYDDRTPLALDGFVDLGRHTADAAVFRSVCDAGVMEPTSANTFSPNHGMTRGDFIEMTTEFFGLLGCDTNTAAFDDVPQGSTYYTAVMTARSAGIVNGATANNFQPDRYISPDAARLILNRTLAYCGMEEQEFTFSRGDYSYMISPYTIRADIAKAFDTLDKRLPLTEAFHGTVLLDGEPVEWSARVLNGLCYIPAASLCETPEEETEESVVEEPAAEEPEEETAESETPEEIGEETEESETPEEAEKETEAETETEESEETAAANTGLPVPMGNTDRAGLHSVTLTIGDRSVSVDGFTYRGEEYVPLRKTAELLGLDLKTGPAAEQSPAGQ